MGPDEQEQDYEIPSHVCSRYVARMQRMLEGDNDSKVPERCVPCLGESYTCKPYLAERKVFLIRVNGNGGNGKGKKTIDDRAVLLSRELPQEPVTAGRGAQDGA